MPRIVLPPSQLSIPAARQKVGEERSAGCVLVRRRGEAEMEALIIRRGDKPRYEIPKGHLEGAETSEQAALRELREETGLATEVHVGIKIGSETYMLPRTGARKTVDYFLARCPVNPGSESFTRSREAATKELKWVSKIELVQIQFKAHAQKKYVHDALLSAGA